MAMKYSLPKSGFNFDNVQRNMALESKGIRPPKATSTGTTIVGIIFKVRPAESLSGRVCDFSFVIFFALSALAVVVNHTLSPLGTAANFAALQDGVVLGADTRSTEGDTVADKNCHKIHYLAPNMCVPLFYAHVFPHTQPDKRISVSWPPSDAILKTFPKRC
ncbi:hypothetical protein BC936DRAFT_145101 [Jimgerdemannia flammicorona]|uniref:Uncharacterized protein n=1 Tax=Jimgerdemannia flammicorona TaxID=994334 RepID=A0A433DLZ7_9FUNG|nr:hypothetical protein BC936DRAFT_145101 [Jimgerdemannia flammicorona]